MEIYYTNGDCWSMGVPHSSLLDLIEKVRAWITWGKSGRTSLSAGHDMDVESYKTCYECKMKFTDSCLKFHCLSCSRIFCRNCAGHIFGSLDVVASGSAESENMARSVVDIKTWKFCSDLSNCHKRTRKFCDKVYPSESPRKSPETPSPNFNSDMFDGYSTHDARFLCHLVISWSKHKPYNTAITSSSTMKQGSELEGYRNTITLNQNSTKVYVLQHPLLQISFSFVFQSGQYWARADI